MTGAKMFDLTGKVAVVTGGSRGIGRSICEQMAAHGARVVVSSRKLPACEEVVKAIEAKGGEATAVAASISDKTQLEALVAEARKAYGRIDIMVCNAASNPYFGPLSGLKEEVFLKIMQNNVMSNIALMNMVGPEMAERKDGVFIIVSSIGGLVGSAHIAAYNMSKAADINLVKSLAMEWGKHNIRVNCIAPGLIKTDFARALWENPQIRAAQESKASLRRIGEPDDIGGVAVFLASKAGSFVCGQTIIADGGVIGSGAE
jgi:NAD(P)-dependent dehydrogenase (short-subunit alcohol dehydrogenase family)